MERRRREATRPNAAGPLAAGYKEPYHRQRQLHASGEPRCAMQRAAEAPWRCLQKRWRRHATARAALSGCRVSAGGESDSLAD